MAKALLTDKNIIISQKHLRETSQIGFYLSTTLISCMFIIIIMAKATHHHRTIKIICNKKSKVSDKATKHKQQTK